MAKRSTNRRAVPDQPNRATRWLQQHHVVERVTETVYPDGTERSTARAERTTHDRVRDQDTLDWLAHRGRISAEQYAAGHLLRTDWQVAGYQAVRAVDWQASGGGKGAEYDRRLDAQDRVRDATRAIGRARSTLALMVCCAATRLGAAERILGLDERSALPVLKTALDDLAEHYTAKRRM